MAVSGDVLLNWQEVLPTGIAEIDLQHKQLVDMLNGLYKASKQGHGHETMGELIHALGDYVLQHFSMEEKYMELTNYLGTAEHKTEHRAFTMKIVSFDREFKQGNVLLTREVLAFLRDWIRDHIAACDVELGRHLLRFGKT